MKNRILITFALCATLLFFPSPTNTQESTVATTETAEFILDDNVALAEGSNCVCMYSPYSVCIGYGGVKVYNMKLVCR